MSVTQVSNLNDILTAIGAPKGTTISLRTGSLQQLAVSNQSLANFPGKGYRSFLVISSGSAAGITAPNISGSQGTDLGAIGIADDTVTLSLTIPVPAGARVLGFDFTFLSEEYPEFVDSSFNDVFSVKMNGTEIALDSNSRPISVNNNFFMAGLSPVGTLFDGQTPPLHIQTPIANGATSVSIDLTVADVADGNYDSAAFLNNLSFVNATQVVFLEFGAATIGPKGAFVKPMMKNAYALSSNDKASVVTDLNNLFRDYLVDFTTTRPASGTYSTLYVGDVPSIPAWYNIGSDILGLSYLDPGNSRKDDIGVVLTNHFHSLALRDLMQVIAHEASHMFGLAHVVDPAQLMYPYAGATKTTLTPASALGFIDGSDTNGNGITTEVLARPDGLTQDAAAVLAANLGLRSAAKVLPQGSLLDNIRKFFTFDFSQLAMSVYNARLMVLSGDGEGDLVIDIGHIAAGSFRKVELPIGAGQKLVLTGQSVEGGGYDVYSSSTGGGGGISLANAPVTSFSVGLANAGAAMNFDMITVNDAGTATRVGAAAASFTTQPSYVRPLSVADLLTRPAEQVFQNLVDFDGNRLGAAGDWKILGEVDVQGDGDSEYIVTNKAIGRWATIGPDNTGTIDFINNSWSGDTRVVGTYIDPLIALGLVVKGSDVDSQRRFGNDLQIDNIGNILGAGDYNGDGLQEIYFSLTDHTAFLHAFMHADGNIQYANYQNAGQMRDYLLANGYNSDVWGSWA